MRVGILGINHKSAELPLREKFAQVCARLFGCTPFLHPHLSYVLLSTCNRTEVYFHAEDPAATHTYILNILRQEIEEEFEHRVYSYFGSDCFLHLARVATGVDSALIGETEIQGQVKRAYEAAVEYRPLHSALHFLFQKCLKIGKNIRSSSRFLHGALSIEEAAFCASAEVFKNLEETKILFVGLSAINYKILTRFQTNGLQQITICNRTDAKAHLLAEQKAIHALPWEKLHDWLFYDIVILGTKSSHFLIQNGQLPLIHSPKLLIDLSVPRNVDPKVGRHPKIKLLNVDQINQTLDLKRRQKAAEIARIETQHIAHAVEHQVSLFRLRELQRASSLLAQVS